MKTLLLIITVRTYFKWNEQRIRLTISLRPIHLLRDVLLRDPGARFGGRHFFTV